MAIVGCSTILRAGPETTDGAPVERAALREAAAALAQAPWPKPSSSSLVERLAGAPDGARVSRDDAIRAYLGRLAPQPAPAQSLSVDAARHLEAARALAAVAAEACDSSNPRLADVALVEDAIADLRETRAIYLAASKKLALDRDAAETLKRSFDDVLGDLGDVADALAESAMKRNSSSLAGGRAPADAL
jgi:hypothetical protein